MGAEPDVRTGHRRHDLLEQQRAEIPCPASRFVPLQPYAVGERLRRRSAMSRDVSVHRIERQADASGEQVLALLLEGMELRGMRLSYQLLSGRPPHRG